MKALRILALGAAGCVAILAARWALRGDAGREAHPEGRLADVERLEAKNDRDARPLVLRPGDPAPDAALVDQEGKGFRLSDLKGRPVVLSFVYTHCDVASMCPTTTRRLARLWEVSSDRGLGAVTFLLVSFDPERDTPERLRAYAAEQDVSGTGLRLATGQPSDIERLARSFNTYFRAGPERRYEHNIVVSLLDAEGVLRARFPGTSWQAEEVLSVLAELAS